MSEIKTPQEVAAQTWVAKDWEADLLDAADIQGLMTEAIEADRAQWEGARVVDGVSAAQPEIVAAWGAAATAREDVARELEAAGYHKTRTVDVVFDGPPDETSGRFIEVEDESGASIRLGEWIDRGHGYWALRFEARA